MRKRAALVHAAYTVIAEKGLAGMTIQDVTERADVSTGSFYNNFSTKEEVFDAACETYVETFGNAVDQVRDFVDDPLEIMVTSERFNLQRAFEDPVWAPFQLQHALVRGSMSTGLARRLQRDLKVAIKAGRLHFDSDLIALALVGGASMGMLVGISEGRFRPSQIDMLARGFARLLGLSDEEITPMIEKPLPPIDLFEVP
jgi:AcrR family transcriptional regulator